MKNEYALSLMNLWAFFVILYGGNEILINISYSIIAATIFYFVVNVFPEYENKKRVKNYFSSDFCFIHEELSQLFYSIELSFPNNEMKYDFTIKDMEEKVVKFIIIKDNVESKVECDNNLIFCLEKISNVNERINKIMGNNFVGLLGMDYLMILGNITRNNLHDKLQNKSDLKLREDFWDLYILHSILKFNSFYNKDQQQLKKHE